LAVTALAGLIYWGRGSKQERPARTEVAAKEQGPHAGKVFDHRGVPKSGEAKRPPAAEDNAKHSNLAPSEERVSELQESAKPGQAPASDSRETPEGKRYASMVPELNSNVPSKPLEPPLPPLTPPVARVAIVIDDFGQNLEIAKKFLELPIPIAFSILPYQRYSQEIAELVHAHHREVILHLPMEPRGYPGVNPGKGALLLSMSDDRIQKSVNTALDSSPYFTGINNHMGSRFTENAAPMRTVMVEAQKRGLYFIDSYTSSRSVASSVAQLVHIPFRRRDIFLDNDPSEKAICAQATQLIRRAKIQGSALAIGHPHESTLRALSQEVEEFEREKIAVVPVGDLMVGF
jgi:hypothetical protein